MKLYHLQTGLLRVNNYFLVNEESREAILIDCGERYKKIKQTEEELGVKIVAVLLTHAHFDHSGCAKLLQDDGAKIYVSQIDAQKLLNDQNLSASFGRKFDYVDADCTFEDGDILTIADIDVRVILTPGHTDGSASFLVDNMLFTGDTLFFGTVGRTDFPTGDRKQLERSLKKLFDLDGDYSVYPGHDEFTTLDYERKHNDYREYD